MDIKHLRYFVAIADAGHMTRAAAQLGVQQPPLSQQIKLLERSLGLELFRRHPRGMSLTEAGMQLLPDARRMLAEMDELERRMTQVAKGITGTVRFGFTSSAGAHRFMPEALAACRRKFPDIEVVMSETPVVIDDLLAGKLHCGLLRLPGQRPEELGFSVLLREALVVALPKGHPLLKRKQKHAGNGLSLLDLKDEGFIISRRPGAPGFYGNLLDTCRKKGFEPRIAAEVERVHTNLNLVAAGMGISVVSESMAHVHSHAIEYRPLAEPRLDSPLTLAWRKQDHIGAIATFVRLLKDLAAGPA